MVRKYKATKRGRQQKWHPNAMKRAIAAIKSGELHSVREAAKRFNVPRTTLNTRCKGIVSEDAPAHKPTTLTQEEEERLVKWCIEREERLFGVTPKFIRETAFLIAERSGRRHHFNKQTKRAGYDWMANFLRRHPQLSIRKPEALSASRARAMNEVVVGRYFDLLDNTRQTEPER